MRAERPVCVPKEISELLHAIPGGDFVVLELPDGAQYILMEYRDFKNVLGEAGAEAVEHGRH